MAVGLPIFSLSSAIRASVDTEQRLPYNRQRTYPKKPETLTAASPSTSAPTLAKKIAKISISDLLKRNISKTTTQGESSESYMGYETWIPKPPRLEKPRSTFNPASLAYLGDCIYELYARRHFLFPPLNIEEYNDRVMAVVRCEAQDAMLQKLSSDNFLSQEERDVLRWGKNIGSSKTRTKKRAGVAVYNRASSLETLVGYLYLTNVQRLDEIMERIGFSSDTSTHTEQGKEKVNSNSDLSPRNDSVRLLIEMYTCKTKAALHQKSNQREQVK